MLSNLIISSCIFYPVKQTCFNTSWSPPQKNWNSSPEEVYIEISSWSKGWIDSFPARGANIAWDNREQIMNHMKNFINGKWENVWLNTHFKNHIIKNLLSYFFIILLFYFCFRKNKIKSLDCKFNILNIYLLIFSFISIIFWFNTAPLLRFGFPQIILFAFCLGNIFLLKTIYIFPKQRSAQILVIVSLSIFFMRSTVMQKVNNFKIDYLRPYPSFYSKSIISLQQAFNTLFFSNNLFLNITNGNNCFDIPFPCSDFVDINSTNIKVQQKIIFKKFVVLNN